MTNRDYVRFIKSWICFFLCIFPTPVPTPDYCSILAAIFLLKEAKFSKQDTDRESAHSGFPLGYSSDLQFDLFHHPMETNSTFVHLYFCSYTLQVLWAERSLHVQGVMHNKSPVLVMASTFSNTKINQIIVTKCQKMYSQRNQMFGRRACTEVSFFPFSLPLSLWTSTLYVNLTNTHPKSKSN